MWSRRRPASLRAVTIVSSRRGWRWTSEAQSAPAKPAAPSTATLGPNSPLLTTQAPADLFLELLLDRGAALGDIGVRERPVVGAELEPQRERLLVVADLLAAVDVEHARIAQELAARRAHEALDVDG